MLQAQTTKSPIRLSGDMVMVLKTKDDYDREQFENWEDEQLFDATISYMRGDKTSSHQEVWANIDKKIDDFSKQKRKG